jgi:hypothetical protein
LRANADALQAFQGALKMWFGTDIDVTVRAANTPNVSTVFNIDYYRRVEITRGGVQLYGTFSAQERTQIKEFLDQLCSAAAEEKLVMAIATQLPMISDEQVFNEFGVATGRVLTIRL